RRQPGGDGQQSDDRGEDRQNRVAVPASRATPPSRLAQARRAASSPPTARAATGPGRRDASAAPAAAPEPIPATVIAAGETRRATRVRRTPASRRAYQGLSAYKPVTPHSVAAHRGRG